MNRIRLAYIRYCNTNKRIRKKRLQININGGIQKIYDSIQSTSDYRGAIHNFLVVYKAMKKNPKSKFLLSMFNDHYIHLRANRSKWKFAKSIYKIHKKELSELKK